jgi:hypothetical protein
MPSPNGDPAVKTVNPAKVVSPAKAVAAVSKVDLVAVVLVAETSS